jgi:hypothetical protein
MQYYRVDCGYYNLDKSVDIVGSVKFYTEEQARNFIQTKVYEVHKLLKITEKEITI